MQKKRILFIAPNFFGYYKEIIKELENQNNIVDYVCDFPLNSSLLKAIGRINRNILKLCVKKYYKNNVLKLINQNQYDLIFIIVGMTFSFFPEMINEIKEKTAAQLIMYQWDGEKNIKFIKEYHKFADKLYTFDREDLNSNSKYIFLPLFYIDKYKEVGLDTKKEYRYDVSYVGTAHPKKLYYINKMVNDSKDLFKNKFIYHYIPSKFKFIFHKITSEEYKNVKYKDLNNKKLSSEEIMDIFKNSKCIFDSPQEGQSGLTIRTLECIGAKRKLITTNKDNINYDFYNPKNIYVYEDGFDKDSIFFKCEYEEIDKDIYEKYSLKSWLKEMIM